MKEINRNHCPICGGFITLVYRRQPYPYSCRFECNKCDWACRCLEPLVDERFDYIRDGKTMEERLERAYRT